MNVRRAVEWTPERKARFVRDWNDGMDTLNLREKYGAIAYRVAERLRSQGYTLVSRTSTGDVRRRRRVSA